MRRTGETSCFCWPQKQTPIVMNEIGVDGFGMELTQVSGTDLLLMLVPIISEAIAYLTPINAIGAALHRFKIWRDSTGKD
jgi:hypothetical protein